MWKIKILRQNKTGCNYVDEENWSLDLGGIRKEGFMLNWSCLKFRIPNQIIFGLVELWRWMEPRNVHTSCQHEPQILGYWSGIGPWVEYTEIEYAGWIWGTAANEICSGSKFFC